MGAIAFFALYAPGRVYDVALAQAVPVLERDLGVDIQYGRRIARGTTLTLEDVRLLDPAADEPTTLASADQLSLTLDPRALVRKQPISGQVEAIRALRRVRLQRPVVHLRRTPKGFDLVDLFAGRQTARPTLPYHLKLEIIDGELHYTDFPLRADGTRDWDTPLPVHLDVDAEGFMRQGILTNAAITVRPPGDTEDLLVLTGGGDFKQAMAGQLRVEMNVGRAFGEGGILANLLPAFGTTLAPVSDYLHRGQVEGTLGFVFGKLPDDPSSPEDESKRWSPPQFSGELVLTDTELRLPGRPDPVLAEAQLELSPGDVRVNRANIRHGPLAAAMTGALSMAEGHPQLTLHFVTTEPFQMPQIAGSLLPFRDTIGYQGPVSAAGTLDVDLPGYTLTAELTSPRVMIAGSPFELIDGSTLKLGYRSAAVGVADLNLQLRNGAQGLGVQGTAHIPRQEYAFNIGVTEVPSALVRRAIPAVQSIPVEGPLSGNIIFLSDPVNRSRADINLMGRDGLAANVPYGALVGRLRYETGKIAIRRLVATPPGRNQGALILHGDYGMGGVMDLHAQLGGVDLAQLLRGSGVSGQLFGRMDLQGTTASPRGTYAAHVLGGEFLGVPFTRLFSEGRFTPTTLTLDSASLVSPGGAAHVSGTIDLTRSPQIRLAGTLLQSGHLVALPAGTAPRNLGGTVEITGDLDAMALAA
ncbi:MAG TPA: hypothetical protein VEI97_05310, partial [bacterium]|nr:hypothetical protein [bacterium]